MCNKTIQPPEINGTIFLLGAEFARAADQLGLKSSRPLSQVGPGSTRPESTRPGVFSERSVTYMYMYTCMMYGLRFA